MNKDENNKIVDTSVVSICSMTAYLEALPTEKRHSPLQLLRRQR